MSAIVQPPFDRLGRPLGSVRVSVTDRCDLRCAYCMPEADYVWLPRSDLLSFEELAILAGAFLDLGVRRLRLTGGEPLLRRDLPRLVRLLAGLPGLDDLSLTTNGVRLSEHAQSLRDAGLHRVTVSLDTLRRERFAALTRADALPRVLEGIRAAHRVFGGLKLDAVIIRGVNEDELAGLLDFGRTVAAEVRFIEYMDVGGATRWSPDLVVSADEILARLGRLFGAPVPAGEPSSAPAARYVLPDGTAFGIIASTSTPFCRSCDRSRLTADGLWYRCLYAESGTDLRGPLRAGASVDEIRRLVTGLWQARTDRGAETRAALPERGRLVPLESLRRDPHLEMHTRGG